MYSPEKDNDSQDLIMKDYQILKQENSQQEESKIILKSEEDKININSKVEYFTLNGQANCPKCKIEIEKIDKSNHMICQNCKYEFCWNCGLKVHHFIHAEWMFFIRCQQTINVKPNLWRSCAYYFLTLILMPFILFFASFIMFCAGGILITLKGYQISVKVLREEEKMVKVFYMILLIPSLTFSYFAAVIAGLLISPLVTAIGLVPAQFIYFYLFIKMSLWRSKLKFDQDQTKDADK
ncbi:ibr domain containing protein [Stylonychia lemnae]|uniref:Ibr domain containing protein n=1 Tax=Stylonychia lemnae TaxID=5949 RepID=A0A078AK74_STYLE|nr:ibr domain containing protein [Stylonychia lemnae]|eukprot:CDW81203.1 ibr domain containing protein [Stylonychia lemnae]